ncbi:MAG: histidinol-phosphate transaminase [Acidiferrobacterales bacterium]
MTTDIRKRVESLVRPEILTLKAYGVADPGDLIKLDAMENPYPWPEALKRDWARRLQQVSINRYPDPQANSLKPALRQAMGVPHELEMMLGNGSDELIQIVMMALARPGAKVMAPTPTFVMYDMTARLTGLEFIAVPLKEKDFSLDVDAMLAAIAQHQPAVIFLAYPNNPTGNLFSGNDIESILNATSGLVVIDEAYHAFAGHSFMARLAEYDNILVMRTVSKLGLAGLRLGLLVGDKEWLAEFDKVRLPYNINSLTQASAEFALVNIEFLQQQTAKLCKARDLLYEELARLDGVEVWPSRANFILFRVKERPADAVFNGLRQRGVLIRNLDKADPALKRCLRVTIGTAEENDAFLTALTRVLQRNAD